MHFAGEIWRNLQADISATAADFAGQCLDVLHFADNAKGFRVHKAIDQLPAFDSAILIQNDHCHVFYVGIERVAEGDHLDERGKEHEEERHRITPDHDEFLEENGAES